MKAKRKIKKQRSIAESQRIQALRIKRMKLAFKLAKVNSRIIKPQSTLTAKHNLVLGDWAVKYGLLKQKIKPKARVLKIKRN